MNNILPEGTEVYIDSDQFFGYTIIKGFMRLSNKTIYLCDSYRLFSKKNSGKSISGIIPIFEDEIAKVFMS